MKKAVRIQRADLEREDDLAEPVCVTPIRLRARRRALWLRALWAEGLTANEQGMAIPHSEVDRILTDPMEIAAAEAAFYGSDLEAQALTCAIAEAEERLTQEGRWRRLCAEFGLQKPEQELLLLTLATEINPLLRRVYGYLNDDLNACFPSPFLAASLFGWTLQTRIESDSTLVRWRLAYPQDGSGGALPQTAPWQADPSAAAYLLNGCAAPSEPKRPMQCLYPETRDAILEFYQNLPDRRVAVEIELIGPDGQGRATLAGQIALALGRELQISLGVALSGQEKDYGIRAIRHARWTGGVLCWRAADTADPDVLRSLPVGSDLTFYLGSRPLNTKPSPGALRRAFFLPDLRREQRHMLWKEATDAPLPAPVADWALTPGEIAVAVTAAPAGPAVVLEACRRRMAPEGSELFTPLPCPYTWEDIVLPPAVRAHLAEFEAQALLRGAVYEEWGFGRLLPMGRGISALFAGPSGTGKTMAAQVVARSLGMELLRIDLAEVMNKYIGETEKRIKRIFDVCERNPVLPFFDEADALFGQRTQVKDAHDRFANIEIDYLLQRVEQFDGVAILATNRKSDLDRAFLRRLRFSIDFLPPGPAERLTLWQRALPEFAPDGTKMREEIRWEFLADRLDMTGADIKNATLGAAFLARSENRKIGMQHILAAARREMSKHGAVLRPGEWEN